MERKNIPILWCPLITPFRAAADPDPDRIAALMRHIAGSVRGILVPGSTGEGWNMDDREIASLLRIVLAHAGEIGQHVLVGALKPDAPSTIRSITSTMRLLRDLTGCDSDDCALAASPVAGFTVCGPTGDDLTQEAIRSSLEEVLELGVPIAIYQLPQVTRNEIAPATIADLARRYDRFFLFKDTSGDDRVARSGLDFGRVFLVRGAEGDYSRWQKAAGGPYDGFLLSTANTFSAELGRILDLVGRDRQDDAEELSRRITRVVETLFPAAGAIPGGNAFANANKAIDHFRAYGPGASLQEGPLLHDGTRLPPDLLVETRRVLEENGFSIGAGYLV